MSVPGHGLCRICRERPADSFEHVPPRRAFNDEPTRAYGLAEWLAREEGGLAGGRIEQRGAGGVTLCVSCNNRTGSWYGRELVLAARAGAQILMELPLEELDASLDHRWATVTFRQHPGVGPHPLRFAKQIVTMLLAISPLSVSEEHPELGEFVLDRDRSGLSERYQLYLALYAGPLARTVGGAIRVDVETRRPDYLVEVAYPPFSYVMTIDTPLDALPTTNITNMTSVRYEQMADVELEMIVGFGHTMYPGDYRSRAMVARDRTDRE